MEDIILFDKYRYVETLGSGGMGRVILAENINLQNYWAIKEILRDNTLGVDLLAEPHILKRLNHHALPRIVDIYETDDKIYIVMDYIEGTPLHNLLEKETQIEEAQAVRWGQQLCDIVAYLHNQDPPIIYRDMKPSNLIVDKNSNIKMIDFGTARTYVGVYTQEEQIALTKGYAAPEQYDSAKVLDSTTDIYGVGATLHHILSGKAPNIPPYEFRPLRQYDSSLSVGIESIVNKCIQPKKTDRYGSAEELKHDLENIDYLNHTLRKKTQKWNLFIIISAVSFFLFSALLVSGFYSLNNEKFSYYMDLVNQGIMQSENKDYTSAQDALQQAIDVYPTRLEAHIAMANSYIDQYQYQECIQYLLESVFPNIPDATENDQINHILGNVYFSLYDYQEACYYYRRAYEQAPDNIYYQRDLAIALVKTGDFGQASYYIELMHDAKDMADIAYYLNGAIEIEQGNFEKAESNIRECILLSDDDLMIKNAAVLLTSAFREHQNSIKDVDTKILSILALADSQLQQKSQIELIEARATAYLSRGTKTGKNAGDILAATQAYEQLLALGYKSASVYQNLALSYQYLREYDQAVIVLQDMISLYPDDYRAHYQLAFLYIEREETKDISERDYSEAVEAYKMVLRLTENTASASDIAPLALRIAEIIQKGWY